MDAIINSSNASFTVNNTINGSVIGNIYPLANANGFVVTSSTGEKVLNLTANGSTVISLANTPGAIGYGNSIFGATDVDNATVAVQAALGLVGSSGGKTSPNDIAAGINLSSDIDTIIAALVSLSSTIQKSKATPIAQTSLSIAANNVASYIIPNDCRCLTICVTSGSLIHYTEDGSIPTIDNCWFGYGSKEIWDSNVPAGATIKLLATSAAIVSFQPRV